MADVTFLTCAERLEGAVQLPPSKSYTHRAVLMASLAEGESRIEAPLLSRDTLATVNGCRAFGSEVERMDGALRVTGCKVGLPRDVINVENSGTTLRFLTSALAAAPRGLSVLTGDDSIRKRPMQPLLDALSVLGVEAKSALENGCAPIVVRGGGIGGGRVAVKGDVSSQFVSSLLISAPLSKGGVSLSLSDAVSRPYIDATVAVMSRFGVPVERDGYDLLAVSPDRRYKPCRFSVPADLSSASFVAAGVALAGGRVVLRGPESGLPQGDSKIFEILGAMGVGVRKKAGEVVVESDGRSLGGGSFDLADTPDLLPVVAVLGLKSVSEVFVSGVRHARFKETDRVAMVARELTKIGARIEEREDGLRIKGGQLRPALVDAHADHRLFMALSLASLLFPTGLAVVGEDSLDVSYPSFLEDMCSLGASVRRGSE